MMLLLPENIKLGSITNCASEFEIANYHPDEFTGEMYLNMISFKSEL